MSRPFGSMRGRLARNYWRSVMDDPILEAFASGLVIGIIFSAVLALLM